MRRQSKTAGIALLILILVTLRGPAANAGECTDPPAEDVARLEQGPSAPGLEYSVYCLGSNNVISARDWAGPNAVARLRALRRDPLNPRIAAALVQLLGSAWADTAERRHALLEVAAVHGIGTLGSLDVFAALTDPMPRSADALYFELAALEDCRAVDVIERRYASLTADSTAGYPGEIRDAISGLYHIPCARAVALARRLRAAEPNAFLRTRLDRVIQRMPHDPRHPARSSR